ncbi:hypothetical protein C479_09488 [Halovivax asiaticus JCM 14624]|uniref:Uncharacterized protein n=1 Tax=Halovivax asiaticus JCM 14624 TaxID=1227490 RepID=M0BL67_9EURY|nr:hypothetical protein C479_09488 [Halovivax asiaticus JCM 14624]
MAAIGFHSATSNAPIQTPANSDTSTCRVVIASTIANSGGASARIPKCSAIRHVSGWAKKVRRAYGPSVDPAQETRRRVGSAENPEFRVSSTGSIDERLADLFRWAVLECPAEGLDGDTVGLRECKRATR